MYQYFLTFFSNDRMLCYDYTIVKLLLLLLLLSTHTLAQDKRLKFNKDGKFKIVQFTDLHYGYNEYENDQTAIVQGN